ncbi:PPE domain-containing protein [Mycobacterium adipatum]|uniref:PPE domain-containing protein n=1 Tax=Mycobacterium adipatum TaxID=1682113 RepID=UPI0034E0C303
MREVRVNPAALRGTAATLAEVKAPSAPTAATPASSHPVSAAAAAQINAVQANIAQLMNHAGLLAQRAAATYESVASRYDAIDAEGLHRIAKAQAAYFTAQGRPTPAPPEPAAAAPAPPVPPHPPEPVCLPHPPDPIAAPQVVDAAASQLSAGDNGASLRALATSWRTQATVLDGYHTAISEAANTTSSQWSGDAATSAIGRLRPFAAWFKDAADSCRDAANHAERVASAHEQAVSEHPTPQYLQEIRTNYSDAVARNNAAEAEQYRQALVDAQTKSTQVVASYAQNAAVPLAVVPPVPSPVNPSPAPPKTRPKPPVEEPKQGPGDPKKKTEPEGTGGSPRPDSAGAGSDDTVAKKIDGSATAESPETIPPPPDDLDLSGPEADDAAALDDSGLQPAAAPPIMPLIQGLTQGLGQAAQGGQGQGMPQMPQVPQMPTMPQTPTPPMTPPMTPPTDAPIEPASFDPMSGGGSGGGGGGGGGGPAPAATSPGLPATAVPLNNAPTGPSAGSPPSASAIGAGMPMGMMPPGAGRGGESDKNREGDLNPDEAIYVEDRPNTSAFLGGRIGPEPPPEAKEE